MIRLENVSKAYRRRGITKTIMRDVSLTLPRGRNVGIMGRNGAGKSTLLRLISGSILPDRGRVVRTGRVSWPLGFAGSFNGALSGEQNIRFVARIYQEDTETLIDYVRDFSELGPSLHLPVNTYSSGMKARLAFGVSMGIHFDTYLIDEITAVGDAEFRRKCRAVFSEKVGNADVIMVSHSMRTLRSICSAGALLNNGKLTYYDDIGDAIASYQALVGEDELED